MIVPGSTADWIQASSTLIVLGGLTAVFLRALRREEEVVMQSEQRADIQAVASAEDEELRRAGSPRRVRHEAGNPT